MKNDAAFKHLWDDPELERIVSEHLVPKQTPGDAGVVTHDDSLSGATDADSGATGGNKGVTTANIANAGDRAQPAILPTHSETAAVN